MKSQHALLSLCADLYWRQDAYGVCQQIFNYAARTERAAQSLQRAALPDLMLPDESRQWLQATAESESVRQFPCTLQTLDEPCHLLITAIAVRDATGLFQYYDCVAIDVSDVRANAASLQRFRAAIDMSLDMVFLVDRETLNFLDVNDTACRNLNRSRKELLSSGPGQVMGYTEQELIERYDMLVRDGGSSRLERILTRPDGSQTTIEVYSRATEIDGRWVIIGMGRDISARKEAETRNLHLQRIFSALSLTNEAVLRANDEQQLYEDASQAAVSSGLFVTASVLVPRSSGRFVAIANAGQYTREPEKVLVTTEADIPEGRGLTSEAWRSGKPQFSNTFQLDERTRPWHGLAQQFDIHSAAAYPLFKRKKCVAVMLFYARAENLFDKQTMAILQSMADNISFALDNFAADEEQQKAAELVRQSEERFRSLTQLTSDFYWEMDHRLRFTRYEGRVVGASNERATQQLIDHPLWHLPGARPEGISWDKLRRQLRKGKAFRDLEFSYINDAGVTYYFALAGLPIFDEHNKFIGYRGISRDITDKKSTSKRIQHLATHDTLTGLPNRVMFTELLAQAARTASRYKDSAFAVLFIDLDRFKSINDSFGHHAGDELLVEVGKRLRVPLRDSDVVARLGGDEFVVLLHKVGTREIAVKISNNILSAVSQPIQILDREFMVSGSIGVSLFGVDAFNAEELMNHADTAMYAAKDQGRNSVHCYSAELHQHTQERASLSLQLRHALAREQLCMHYQAKVDLDSGTIVGVEALMRWHHPDLGDISPAQFIPIAEDNGLMVPIGAWALQTALAQLRVWDDMGLPALHMAVNLSARQFNDPELGQHIRKALEQQRIDPSRLELEITESLVVQNPDHAIRLMRDIKRTGVRFALDDFGTGYSSLGQLRHYPIDTLKIDRAFVNELDSSKEDQAISKAIISLAKTLGLTVVAEGVETQAQIDMLRSYECDQSQGFLCHRPAPADEFAAWFLKTGGQAAC